MIENINIDPSSTISGDTVLKGNVKIGKNCKIISSIIENCTIGDNVTIIQSCLENSIVHNKVTIGPYAHLRPQSEICDEVHLGNFVEIKNSVIGKRSKVPHLSYVGDAEVGEDVNIGCGVVFANYDGKNKHKTIVGNRVFIGSNANLVAPLFIEDESFIAAGTTVTKNMGKGEFCIGRVKQQKKTGMLNLYTQKFDEPLKYFGTDGIRGVFGEDLTLELCKKVGFALTKLTPNAKVLLGTDTRPSGKAIFESIAEGIVAGGGEVYDAGIIPTAGIAYLTKLLAFDYGISITASHNTSEYNGIKIFNSSGYKLNENKELELEKALVLPKKNKKVHTTKVSILAYIELLESINQIDLTGTKVLLDCANGASSFIAPDVFKRLGAEVVAINTSGEINKNSGVLCYDTFIENMKQHDVDIGFSFDGDADRVIACTKEGEIINGDKMLYIFAKTSKEKYVVGTIMTNYALEKCLSKIGTKLIRTNVGDKHIARAMKTRGYKFGAEESGHAILADYHTTGDGILTALYLLNIFKLKPKIFKDAQSLELYPVYSDVVITKDKSVIKRENVVHAIKDAETALANFGRVIVRASGTEPKIRITVESKNAEVAKSVILNLKSIIANNIVKQD